MTTRDEKRLNTLLGLGLFAIGISAFLMDEHVAHLTFARWRELTIHNWIQLGIAGFGLLWTPMDPTPAKQKLDLAARVVPWIRRSSSSTRKPEE
jgi:hypothetical protein